ncbi:unnamed protein product, partial [marine sediment metagenome]
PDAAPAERQLRGLWDRGIAMKWESLPAVGISAGTSYPRGTPHIWYRDIKTGRFTSYADVASRMGWFYKK